MLIIGHIVWAFFVAFWVKQNLEEERTQIGDRILSLFCIALAMVWNPWAW